MGPDGLDVLQTSKVAVQLQLACRCACARATPILPCALLQVHNVRWVWVGEGGLVNRFKTPQSVTAESHKAGRKMKKTATPRWLG